MKQSITKLATLMFAMLIFAPTYATTKGPNPDTIEPPLYMFIAEMETFLEKAKDIHGQGTALSDDELKKKIDDMIIVAGRASKIYFLHIEDAQVKPDLDKYLHERITDNSDLRHFFVLMGNQFLDSARAVLNKRSADEKRFRTYSTVGGTVLGLAAGGAVLYFAKGLAKNALTAGLIVVGLGAAGGVGGYIAGPMVANFMLPADPSIKNSDDFLKRYPAGEDFVLELEQLSPDLALALSTIEEEMNAKR